MQAQSADIDVDLVVRQHDQSYFISNIIHGSISYHH